MLGDHLYRSRHPEQTSCVRQLIERYQETLTPYPAYPPASPLTPRLPAYPRPLTPPHCTPPPLYPPTFTPHPPPLPPAPLPPAPLPPAPYAPRPLPPPPLNPPAPYHPLPTPHPLYSPSPPQGTSLIALRKTHLACVSQFGCATGTWEALPPPDRKAASRAAEVRFNSPTLHVTALAEKPSQHEARAMLATPGLADDEFLCAFGLYLVAETQTLFDALEATPPLPPPPLPPLLPSPLPSPLPILLPSPLLPPLTPPLPPPLPTHPLPTPPNPPPYLPGFDGLRSRVAAQRRADRCARCAQEGAGAPGRIASRRALRYWWLATQLPRHTECIRTAALHRRRAVITDERFSSTGTRRREEAKGTSE